MKIRAERDELGDLFARAGRAVGARTALPILQGLLCAARGKLLHIVGTDLEMTVWTSGEVEVLEEGEAVVTARLATDAIRKLPPGAVTLSVQEGEVELEGQGPKFRLRELQREEFPHLTPPDFAGAGEVDGEVLQNAINQVTVAASADAARPILTGVLYEGGEEGLRLVATDSYRLAVRDLPEMTGQVAGLVPARGLREFARSVAAPKVQVAIGDREAGFRSEKGTVAVRLIEGTFPNYRQLLPDQYPNFLITGRDQLLEALGRASLVAEDHIPVHLRLSSGGVEMSVSRQDVGGEREFIEGEYEGEDIEIAFNPRYLADGIGVLESERVRLKLLDGLKPALIQAADDDLFRYLLMPVRT